MNSKISYWNLHFLPDRLYENGHNFFVRTPNEYLSIPFFFFSGADDALSLLRVAVGIGNPERQIDSDFSLSAMAIDGEQSHKSHRSRQSGPTAKKKSKSDKKIKGASDENNKQHNPKAFAFNSMVKAKKMQARATEKEQKRFHVPTVDRPTGEPAPYAIVVQGPPKVGKSLLIKSLVKHYTKQNLPEVRGPITIVSEGVIFFLQYLSHLLIGDFCQLYFLGFGDKWLKWIETCIKTVKFSVLVNGEPVGFFESERGLRQDDTIILCDPVEEHISYIRVILVLFEAVSGLQVNWGKSSLFPVNEVPQIKEMAGILGCSVGKLPTTYLGMPLGNNHKALEIWDSILEKTEKKLSGWKAQYLSLGGRLILINSVLDSLPTYVMSLFPIPGKVVENLDKLRRKFLWQGNKDGKGYSLVNWETALLSKDRGGLGIKNLKLQNESLLKKWLWRYTEERNALWKEVIIAKYGELNPWCTEITTEPYGVGAWRSIRNLWSQMETNLYIKVGSGSKTKFWKDVWIDQSPLRDLFQICGNPDANVGDCWTKQGWDLVFRRLFNDWEVERVAEILGMLGGVTINANATDRMLWKHNKDGLFSVNSAYRRGLQVMEGRPKHLGNYFWKGDIPTKVKCFTWLVIKRVCLTQEVLQKKGRQLVTRMYIKRVEELGKERRYQEPKEMVEVNTIMYMVETFEFLNILQNHGFPKVMGVLTHFDQFKDVKKLKKMKQRLKHRFWTEIYDGAKLFYLCGLIHGNLFLPCPYSKAASQYDQVHIAGVGDYSLAGITALPDPCPLPSAAKMKGLRDKEKLFYAPMSGLGDLLYDKDAVYTNINDHFV
ncbi:hypothetical protein MTR67_005156 [Solanum verrucosum]|uniref:Reverse transcriptase zinc-binding domain-containing protein n=1 Tax=Solanum verrucosum TaxID=315347 RepID=A0AAF0Q095_SOLVR|nr:hypothetical protein MTR67_005156 [Solanum verrucosum]